MASTQECIPVAVAVRERSPPGTPPGTRQPPPVDRHTPVNILPCPKLRLRAVKISRSDKFSLVAQSHLA